MTWAGYRVYVFGVPGDNLVKVGFSGDAAVRARTLRLDEGMPRARLLFAFCCRSRDEAIAVEQGAHDRLMAFHLEREWFLADAETAIEAIEQASAEHAPKDCLVLHPAVNRRQSLAAKAAWETRRARYGRSGNPERAA